MIIGITDRQLYKDESNYLKCVGKMLSCDKIDYIILREVGLSYEAYETYLGQLCRHYSELKEKMIVYTHIELAKKYGIKRVHLPERLWQQKAHLPYEDIIFSTACHDCRDVEKLGTSVDFFLISPIYPTTCKPKAKTIDLEEVKALMTNYGDRMVLLGGLDQDKIKALQKEGFSNFALRSGINDYL